MIVIDGVKLPAPTKIDSSLFDLDSSDSSRNEEGKLQRDRVRGGISKVSLEWRMLSSSELYVIQNVTTPAKFDFTFPTALGQVTLEMYAGDKDIKMVVYDDDPDKRRWDISFGVVEY